MIKFTEKLYTEYDAMRQLYVSMSKKYNPINGGSRTFKVIDSESPDLLRILKGNSIVIEKFTVSERFIGPSKYLMYIRIGAKAKMPDEVRLPEVNRSVNLLGNMSISLTGSSSKNKDDNNNNQPTQKNNSDKDKKDKGTSFNIKGDLRADVSKLLGDAVIYDKRMRRLVLRFDSVNDAVDALNLLPFGINYNLYLLD